jgi:hypothetical protein
LQYKFIEKDNRGIFCFVVNCLKLILGGGGGGLVVVVAAVIIIIIIVCTKFT